jgi:hypothetical protein
MKKGIIIATVKYRYAKIGPCCMKRHRPSLVWTISNSSRPIIERSSESTSSRLWRGLNQTGSAQERSISGRPHITTPAQDQYIREFHLRNRYSHCYSHCCWFVMFTDNLRRCFSRTRPDPIQQGKPWISISEQHYCIAMTFKVELD